MLWSAATAVAWWDPTNDFVKAEMERQRIPGLSLTVVKDGGLWRHQHAAQNSGYGGDGVQDRFRQQAIHFHRRYAARPSGAGSGIRLSSLTQLRHQGGDYIAVDIGESDVAAPEAEGQLGVVESQQVKDRCVEIMHCHGIFGRFIA
jgi:hypothetical protein